MFDFLDLLLLLLILLSQCLDVLFARVHLRQSGLLRVIAVGRFGLLLGCGLCFEVRVELFG